MREELKDGHGRRIEYLRVSVTDRCNLKCAYCMPPGGVELSPRCDMLRFKDLIRLIGIFGKVGVRKVRLTGGEPLIRKGIVGFIRQVNKIPGIEQIALTTNGQLLNRMAGNLKEAGVKRVNISLDSLQKERFQSITGHDGLTATLEGIDAVIKAGVKSVKINMVVIKGVNDDEVEAFADMSRRRALQIRFIEFMPATPEVWDESRLALMSDVKKRVERIGKLIPCEKSQWGGPAEIYRFKGAVGEVGFISAVSHHFCAECNRLRLTSTGELLTCLFGDNNLDLKSMLARDASGDEIEAAIKASLKYKNKVRDMAIKQGGNLRRVMTCVGG